ncbi:predicted protein [Sclerotinia sclerotiorum 1980 UF-70]|uniref:Uncharacterized protein n=1 Tax=Sclerotinia sclerotiorum (strain ATCC 18683 / 1980 / Ss-1) TaxID=665079 RepID=A7F6T7_SCLS1|nr:predicted protein [Sclerotinia sclerotiorum 1980 UF-70]EDN98458.1 predicted protein [Sclerotinia sclerotiorum 1980 UF-70]
MSEFETSHDSNKVSIRVRFKFFVVIGIIIGEVS